MRRHRDQGEQGPHPSRSASAGTVAGGRPRRRSASTVILGTLAVLIAVVLAGGSLAAYMKYRSVWDGINHIDVSSDLHGKRPPPDPNAMNILLIGSDTRAGENGAIGGRQGIAGQRSDTVMVVHIAPGAHQVVVMSIPRDSVVPILKCTAEDGTVGQTAQPSYDVEQINSTFAYGGPGCLWESIEQTTGIHINDFIELNFVGFEKVIDALHGVEVCLPEAVDDPKSGLRLKAGRHHVYGREALAFWRTREDLGLGDDPQRIQRDQFLMAGLFKGIEHSDLLSSPSTMLRVIDTLTSHKYVTTDSGLSPETLLRIGEDLRGISASAVQFVTVPWTTYTGDAQWIDSSQSQGTGNADWVQWQQPEANDMFSAIAHDTKIPKSGKTKTKTVSPASVDVKVLNGTSTSGLGARTAASLTGRGFQVVGSAGNAPTDTYTSTVIEYRDAADLPAADTLAGLIGKVTLKHDPRLRSSALHLILGSTFTGLKPVGQSGSNSSSAISSLAKKYNGITASTNICNDKSAFAGPDGS